MLPLDKVVLLSKNEAHVEAEQESINLHKSKMAATADTEVYPFLLHGQATRAIPLF